MPIASLVNPAGGWQRVLSETQALQQQAILHALFAPQSTMTPRYTNFIIYTSHKLQVFLYALPLPLILLCTQNHLVTLSIRGADYLLLKAFSELS